MTAPTLGRSGPEVSSIGLGCMGMSTSYGPPPDRAEMIIVIRRAVELGVTFFVLGDRYPEKLKARTRL